LAKNPESEKPIPQPGPQPHYQPSTGRKLFMLGMCVLGLIFIWIFYFLEAKKP